MDTVGRIENKNFFEYVIDILRIESDLFIPLYSSHQAPFMIFSD